MSEGNEQNYMTRILRNRWFQLASALGVIFGLIGFVTQLPPVSEWLFGKRTAMSLEVVSQLPVFNVSQPVPGLSVVLEGQDLKAANQVSVASTLQVPGVQLGSLLKYWLIKTRQLNLLHRLDWLLPVRSNNTGSSTAIASSVALEGIL